MINYLLSKYFYPNRRVLPVLTHVAVKVSVKNDYNTVRFLLLTSLLYLIAAQYPTILLRISVNRFSKMPTLKISYLFVTLRQHYKQAFIEKIVEHVTSRKANFDGFRLSEYKIKTTNSTTKTFGCLYAVCFLPVVDPMLFADLDLFIPVTQASGSNSEAASTLSYYNAITFHTAFYVCIKYNKFRKWNTKLYLPSQRQFRRVSINVLRFFNVPLVI